MSSHRDEPRPFRYDAEVDPGEKRHVDYEIGETYLGKPVEIPVTIVNGEHPGPRLFLSAAIHGDEVNGVKVLQEVADRYDPAKLHGTLVIAHVLNVPGYTAQQRYLPIYDQDINRKFPGTEGGSTASRMAKVVYDRFVSRCDFGLDFHTSTRNRMTVLHARADMDDEGVRRLVDQTGVQLTISGAGAPGMMRRVATEDGTPLVTVEMGEANRFQPLLIDLGRQAVENVLAANEMYPGTEVRRPEFTKVLDTDAEKRWIRADHGGLVEMKWGPLPVVDEGETICVVSDHFKREQHVVSAPFDGFLVGILANPRVLPGHPLVHLVSITDEDREAIRAAYDRVGFLRHGTFHWMGRTDPERLQRLLAEDDRRRADGGT
ncbi:succinylglutamate desuccinylase/aspartoacylase family protein [Halobaculum lipolyticum]|uniref:Succinylglutamate desuccinylase/aspartoacylase family protein n=1 Tax=Halobaculum lipolyticum TaxID=3032001 RepID=A0ABD5W9J5_9EURY|nr:succinylglutamate desuccinylase/aspartoacylase family protein [Halobaculum sp. DT31]